MAEDEDKPDAVIEMQVHVPPEADKMRVSFNYDLSAIKDKDDINYWFNIMMGMRYMLLTCPHKLLEMSDIAAQMAEVIESEFAKPEEEKRRMH